jgi:TorA maturation chaperone TorD
MDSMDETSSNMAASRAAIYSLLGSLYLNTPDLKSLEKSLNQLLVSTRSQGIGIIEDFFRRNKGKSLEKMQNAISVEYSRLFLGISYGYGLPPPYESVWAGEERVMGMATVNVMKTYAEAGLELAANMKQPPDHVGIELGYLSYLCSKEADAWKTNDLHAAVEFLRLQEKFLHDHIDSWVPNFCRKIAENDRTGLYCGIATMTSEFLEATRDELREELKAWKQQPP